MYNNELYKVRFYPMNDQWKISLKVVKEWHELTIVFFILSPATPAPKIFSIWTYVALEGESALSEILKYGKMEKIFFMPPLISLKSFLWFHMAHSNSLLPWGIQYLELPELTHLGLNYYSSVGAQSVGKTG